MGYDLGVDLGTTFVASAICRGGHVEMSTLGNQSVDTPAVVCLTENCDLVFGEAADRLAISRPDRVERAFKRRLGDPSPVVLAGVPYQVTALMGALLRDVLTKVASIQGSRPDRVVLTHPANWGPYRRELFEEIPRLAGATAYHTLTEPEAAAAYYATSRRVDDGALLAVYDLGGGTFDATVLRKQHDGFELLGEPEGIERLGGIDFDEAILQWINHSQGGVLSELDLTEPRSLAYLVKLRRECMLAKEALSADTETVIPVLLPDRHFSVQLTRAEFESMIRASVESTIGTLVRTVQSAQVDPNQLSAVLLVGGSSRIPLVARLIADEVGRPTVVDAHPKYAVALGAATIAARLPLPPARPSSGAVRAGSHPGRYWAPPVSADDRQSDAGTPVVPVSAAGTGRVPDPPRPSAGRVRRRALMPWRRVLVGLAAVAVAVVLAVVGFQAFLGGNAKEAGASNTSTSPSPDVAVAVPALGPTINLGRRPDFVVASPSGRHLYIADAADAVLIVFDTAVNQVTATIPVPAGPPRFLAFSPDGRFLYVSVWDRPGGRMTAVSVLDTADNAIAATIPIHTRPFLAAVSSDGRLVYVPNHDSSTVSVIDAASRRVVVDITVAPDPDQVALSTDGKVAYTADQSDLVTVIDTATDRVSAEVQVGQSPRSLAVNPKRPLLVVVNHNDNTLSVVDTNSNRAVKTVPVGRNPQNVTWSPDGRFAYVVNNGDGSVSVISADSLSVTATIPTGPSPTSIAVLPDGSQAYVSNHDGSSLTRISISST